VSTLSPQQVVADLLPKLRSHNLCYFPIRHHSPACAAHLRRWIETRRPASVLVEGPASFTPYIDLLTDDRCAFPVALYTSFVDKRGRLSQRSEEGKGPALDLPRFAAYYPFCDYSPELVALRAGRAARAALRFIDLEYAEMVLTRMSAEPDGEREAIRIESLAADPHLLHSAYVRSLAKRLGCRDFNELWDHLFEGEAEDAEPDAFIDRLAAYCALARFDYTPEALQRDATTAREACMAAAVRDELARNKAEKRVGPVLVVTGGFHTVVLPDLVARAMSRPPPVALTEGEAGTWLMRYSFDQLDALSGYASGMPSPAYYDRLWRAGAGADGSRMAADVIVEIGRLARERNLPTVISTPDAIAAVQTAQQLAALRGHRRPLREDVLDGIRSCFVKGEMGTEGQLLMRLVQHVLAGDRVGTVPPGTAVPPIVADFQGEARRCRLPIDSVERREIALDLYRNANHRRTSRLLHRLDLLGAPFAVFLAGPDFVQAKGLDLMQEHWRVCWSPATESALIEASLFGPTVEEAAAAKLRRQIAQLEDEGAGRNTAAAVALLVRACRLGLHRQAADIMPLIDVHIAGDPSFPSVVAGLSQLDLLAHAREPLEAADLPAVPRLTTAAYQRACRLLTDTAGCPDEVVDAVLGAMRTLREVLAACSSSTASAGQGGEAGKTIDPDLFHQGLRRVVDHPPSSAQAAVVGAAVGILYGEGLFSQADLVRTTRGYLGAAADPRKSAGVLRGLLATAREAAWQAAELIQAVDAQFVAWDEKTFLAALPDLRLAFTGLTPREIAKVADNVAQMHGASTLGELVHADLDENEVRFALEVTQRVRETLRADGLPTGGD
jgi:Family of unknown function (DUF5682)